MLYPNVSDKRKKKNRIRGLFVLSILFGIILLGVNWKIQHMLTWSLLAIAGIGYSWITTIYSLKKDKNFALHVVVQMIAICVLLVVVDRILGRKDWAIQKGIPIVMTIANLTMLSLIRVNEEKLSHYLFYQIIVLGLTFLGVGIYIFLVQEWNWFWTLTVAIGGSILVLLVTIWKKELCEEIKKIIHM